jgi:hypothetical protein
MTVDNDPKGKILAACNKALSLAPSEYPVDLPAGANLLGASEWYGFEWQAWEIGESIRQQLLGHSKLKNDAEIINKIISVIQCNNLRRGRQPLCSCLGSKELVVMQVTSRVI